MKKGVNVLIVMWISVTILASVFCRIGFAHEKTVDNITIVHPRLIVASADADTGYLAVTIVNRGVTTETLRAVYSNEAKNIRIEDNGKRTFISIPGNSTLRTDSDGISVKFHGLRGPHIEETWMSLVLLFERAGEVAVDAVVQIYSAGK